MKFTSILAVGAALTAANIAPAEAASLCDGCGFYLHYDVTADYEVSKIAILDTRENGAAVTNSFSVGVGETTITNPFPNYVAVTGTFLLGIAQDLPNDPEGQKHLVIFANNSWAASAQSIAFGTLFPSTLEESLITALENIGGASTDEAVLNASYDALFQFSSGEAANGPNGSVLFAPGDSFSLIAFSDGALIGTGTTFTTLAPPPAPVPEPASWALMLGGFGVLGAALRRQGSVRQVQFA